MPSRRRSCGPTCDGGASATTTTRWAGSGGSPSTCCVTSAAAPAANGGPSSASQPRRRYRSRPERAGPAGRVVARLPIQQRTAVALYYVEGLASARWPTRCRSPRARSSRTCSTLAASCGPSWIRRVDDGRPLGRPPARTALRPRGRPRRRRPRRSGDDGAPSSRTAAEGARRRHGPPCRRPRCGQCGCGQEHRWRAGRRPHACDRTAGRHHAPTPPTRRRRPPYRPTTPETTVPETAGPTSAASVTTSAAGRIQQPRRIDHRGSGRRHHQPAR